MNSTTATNELRLALDTNVLAYIEGVNGISRQRIATEFVAGLPAGSTFVPVQVLGELFRVLVGKVKQSRERARAAILNCLEIYSVIETSPTILRAAVDLSADHDLSIWDAIILASAASAGCRLLLTEDMQEGFTWSGVTVVNPFAKKRNTLLDRLLETD
jgi:predicted nucleic acid-binding protein